VTAVLDRVLALVAGAVAPAITPEARNVLRFPAVAPATIRHGVLAHTEGGLTTDASLRPRVSVLLGPGATFQGTADALLGLYAAAAGAGGSAAPTRDELARAIVVYNQHHLPAGTWVEHRVGLRLPLPVEIDVDSGAWIVNADSVRTWAGSFDGAWLGRLTRAPDALEVPDPLVELPQAAAALLAAHPDALSLGAELAARMLRNPFADVFLTFAALRGLGAAAPEAALSVLDNVVGHQAALLAATSAGSAVLRRLDAVLAGAPGTVDPARVTRARALVDAALFAGAPGHRSRVPFSELPETAAQLASRGPLGAAGAGHDPPGGYHRLVLGRDVAVGRIATETILGVDYRGPAYQGRLAPAPFAAADAALLPTDAQSTARLEIVVGIAANEGNLDAIRLRDLGVIASGIHQWSAHQPDELPSLLHRFKALAGDEWDLFFAAYGLDVDPDPNAAHVGQFVLQTVAADGTRTPMAYPAIRAFFGGAVAADGTVSFGTAWAARFRLAALASEAYRRSQILEAVGRFDRIKRQVGSIEVAGTPIAVDQLISSKQGVALILDSHINKPGRVRPNLRAAAQTPNLPTAADARDRKLTAVYHDTRDVYDRVHRNQGVDAHGFDVAHGSFTGW
jgi:hypothetical protein